MASPSPTTSPTISCVIPCSLTPRRRVSLSSGSSPPSSPSFPSTPPSGSYEPECITTDASPPAEWGVSRLVRFDNECVVIPDSEWFACADHGNGEGGSKGGFKAVFGLNKMKKVVVVNRTYSLPLWPAGGSSSSARTTDDEAATGESGTEDESAHHRKVVRLNFKVPIPTFTPERPQNAARHPHLRTPSVEFPAHPLPTTRGRRNSRERTPSISSSTAIPISPILLHRGLSPDASRSPSRGFAPGTSPPGGEIAHHPHNALYTNPRMDPVTSSYIPVPSSPPAAPVHLSTSPSMDSAVFAPLPELIPLRPCCENCSKGLEEALRQGEEWKEKFTRGAKRRRRRSSSAASASSVASSVVSVDGGGGPTTSITAVSSVVCGHPAAAVIDAVPVVTPAKRPALTVSTVPTCIEEETDQDLEADADADADAEQETETEEESAAEEAGAEPIPTGKLTMAVVDEVEGLKRRSASGSSLSKMLQQTKTVPPPPVPASVVEAPIISRSSSSSSASSTSSADPTPIASTSTLPSTPPRKFLDVPSSKPHGRISSDDSMSSFASNGSGDSVGSSGSGGSAGSRGSVGSRSSARSNGSYKGPGPKSILKNSPTNSPIPSPLAGTPPRNLKRHSYHGTPRDQRREDHELLVSNTLRNMNIGAKDRGKDREKEKKKLNANVIDLSQVGDLRRKVVRDADQGQKEKSAEEDDDMLFPLPMSPKGSPCGTPDGTTPRASNSPDLLTPRGGSPRISPKASPYSSPRISPRNSPYGSPNLNPGNSRRSSPRASPLAKPSPLSVVSPVNQANRGIELVQGGVGGAESSDSEVGEGTVIRGSIKRKAPSHVRTASEPSVRTSISGGAERDQWVVVGEGGAHAEDEDYFNFPRVPVRTSPSQQQATTATKEYNGKQKEKTRQGSPPTGSPRPPSGSPRRKASGGDATPKRSPRASPGPATPRRKASGDSNTNTPTRQGRKTATSFSAFGRNLRVLGADIMKGVGSIGGMGPPAGY